MKDSKAKSYFFLGLGLGIILVNIIHYFNVDPKKTDMSDEMIISRAEELGMVYIKDNIILEKELEENKKSNSNNIDKIEESKDDKADSKKKETYKIVIKSGDNVSDVASQLYDKGLIKDKKEFNKKIETMNASKFMKIGEFDISTDDSMDEIINKIANIK